MIKNGRLTVSYDFIFYSSLHSFDKDHFLSEEKSKEITERFKNNFYKCICLFVDNSGFDIVMGVLPLVIEFLKDSNTKVSLKLKKIF